MKNVLLCLALVISLFLFVSLVRAFNPDPKAEERRNAAAAVEFCREQVKKGVEEHGNGVKFLYGACDQKAADFKKKYGYEP